MTKGFSMSRSSPFRLQFEHPPLVEKALAVVFEPLPRFTIADFGLFWTKIQSEFPDVSTEEPVEVQTELFAPQPKGFNFQIEPALVMPRAMYRAAAGELVQLQNDRFGFNWVKVGSTPYPQSDAVMARFDDLYARFCAFVSERELGELRLRQCEMTNLNIMPVSDFGADYGDLTKLFNVDPLEMGVPFLRAATYTRSRQHLILGDDGEPVGRLHTSIEPVIATQDNSKAFKLELTARSAPAIGSIEEARRFFEVARDSVNCAFRAITTQSMRDRWGEKHG